MTARAAPANLLLALDTATTSAVAAVGEAGAPPLAGIAWSAGYRHGQELLARIDELLDGAGRDLGALAGIVVGTGPGAFTGLRVGLATAKGLAHALAIPLVGVSTGSAILAAARAAGALDPGSPAALLLPAGPNDRVLMTEAAAPQLLPGGTEPDLPWETVLVAVDLAARAPESALARGEVAIAGLGAALLRLGGARLDRGEADDLAEVVPEYVSLPRGVRELTGAVTWSRDPR